MAQWTRALNDALRRFRCRVAGRSGEARNVAVIAAGGLGDTVMFALGLPRLQKLCREGETLTVILRKDAARMAFLFGPGVEVEIIDFNKLAKDGGYRTSVFKALYKAHYRLLISADFLRHPYLDEALIRAAQPARALAMEPRSWRKYDKALQANRSLYARLFDSGPAIQDKIVRWSRFNDWLLEEGETPPPKVNLAPDTLAPPAKLERPTIVIQPFSAVKGKQSPPELYGQIIDQLGTGYDVVIAGGPGDLEKNPDYAGLLERTNVRLDTSPFEDCVPLLRAATLVISVDTAMMHLAAAVGAPTLCLASAAYVGEIVPYDDRVMPENLKVLYHHMPCEGCLGDCPFPREDAMYPCVARLETNRVFQQVSAMLSD
ncbi:MAG: glycosyltransferase family 9 protein [Magnetovibrionaceae bacterium]